MFAGTIELYLQINPKQINFTISQQDLIEHYCCLQIFNLKILDKKSLNFHEVLSVSLKCHPAREHFSGINIS